MTKDEFFNEYYSTPLARALSDIPASRIEDEEVQEIWSDLQDKWGDILDKLDDLETLSND